jgi:hypothetical protein
MAPGQEGQDALELGEDLVVGDEHGNPVCTGSLAHGMACFALGGDLPRHEVDAALGQLLAYPRRVRTPLGLKQFVHSLHLAASSAAGTPWGPYTARPPAALRHDGTLPCQRARPTGLAARAAYLRPTIVGGPEEPRQSP